MLFTLETTASAFFFINLIYDTNALFFFLLQLRVVLAVLLPVAAYQSPLPIDCSDIYRAGSGLDGVYTIYPAGPTSPVQVYCDMSKDNIDNSAEKWTVMMEKNLRHMDLSSYCSNSDLDKKKSKLQWDLARIPPPTPTLAAMICQSLSQTINR